LIAFIEKRETNCAMFDGALRDMIPIMRLKRWDEISPKCDAYGTDQWA
jgi:hypothetical protein